MPSALISREEAYVKGLTRFYTGEPCKHGHVCERFVVNSGCVLCQNWTRQAKKERGPRAANIGWPPRGLVFRVPSSEEHPRVLPEEMEAAYLYLESMRWHDYAVVELRKNPELMKQFGIPLSIKEQGKLHAALERHQRVMERIRKEIGK